MKPKVRRVIGLMSGTSLDGIDAAFIETDGLQHVRPGPWLTVPYPDALRARLRAILGAKGPIAEVEREVTLAHAAAVRRLIAENKLGKVVDLIGFHGHTILHRPEERRTWQIGDGGLLARETGIGVVCDFRSADVAAGGEGAPLAPVYHRALFGRLDSPVAVLNVGGVANATWLGPDEAATMAFDTGPGNALVDDWVLAGTGRRYDEGGALALKGKINEGRLERWLKKPYFARPAPKSLDRDDFADCKAAGLSLANGAATLTAFTAAAVAGQVGLFPAPPKRWLVTGGGRHNKALVALLERLLRVPVDPVEAEGADGDALEAQAFAYMAVRTLEALPISFPLTTRAPRPMTGGRFFPPP
jgi:anhydro-N-acetylmuramic acid kinase